MSRYAKLIDIVVAWSLNGSRMHKLYPNTAIKNVEIDGEGYAFEALFSDGWQRVTTAVDLPAFTDRGRAQREARRERVAKRGRPSQNRGRCMITLPVRPDQKAALQKIAADQGTDLAGLVRRAMLAKGMPL